MSNYSTKTKRCCKQPPVHVVIFVLQHKTSTTNGVGDVNHQVCGRLKSRYFTIIVAPRQHRTFVGDGWIPWGRDSLRQQPVNGREAPLPNEHLDYIAGDQKGVLHILQ